MSETKTIELPQGTISYRERGEGEPIVFVHGLLVDSRLWDGVAEGLAGEFRCIQPDLPLGSHQRGMSPDAELSPVGQAEIVADFIEALGLERATLVGNDSGGAISQILASRHPERIERLILTNCDMFENFPPFPFSLMPTVVRLPAGMTLLQAPFRIGALARATYGLLAARPIPPQLVAAWVAPSRGDHEIVRDTRKLILSVDKQQTIEAAERLRGFDRPTLLVWGTADRFFKLDEAKRFAALIPGSRLVEIAGAKTFVPLDEPERVAEEIGSFMRERAASAAQPA